MRQRRGLTDLDPRIPRRLIHPLAVDAIYRDTLLVGCVDVPVHIVTVLVASIVTSRAISLVVTGALMRIARIRMGTRDPIALFRDDPAVPDLCVVYVAVVNDRGSSAGDDELDTHLNAQLLEGHLPFGEEVPRERHE